MAARNPAIISTAPMLATPWSGNAMAKTADHRGAVEEPHNGQPNMC